MKKLLRLSLAYQVLLLCNALFCEKLNAQDCPQPQPGIKVCDNSVFCNGAEVCIENVTAEPEGLTFEWKWPDITYTEDEVTTETRVIELDPECNPIEDITIFLTAIRECDDGSQQKTTVAALVTIVSPPTVNLPDDDKNTTLCLPDQEACFNPSICPTDASIRTVTWVFSDGFTSEEASVCHNFPQLGAYQGIVTVESFASGTSCGIDKDTATINVFAEPIPIIEYEDVLYTSEDDTLQACTNRGITILNRSESANEGRWRLREGRAGRDFEVLQENTDTLSLNFSQPGTYTLELEAISTACNPQRSGVCRHTIVVSESNGVELQLDAVDCEPITINPRDSLTVFGDDTNLIWTIGNETINNPDPGPRTFDETTEIKVSLESSCGIAEDLGRISILGRTVAEIDVLEENIQFDNDTIILCKDSPSLTLYTSVIGGNWEISGNETAGLDDTTLIFNPVEPGTFTITYGNKCITREPVTIIVNGADPEYTVPLTHCLDGSAVPFSVSPNTLDGVWVSENGSVTDEGIFDPQIAGIDTFWVWYEYGAGECEFVDSFLISVSNLQASFETLACSSDGSGTTVTFESIPEADQVENIAWDFGDGTTGAGSPVSHTFINPGSYSVRLIVSSGECVDTVTQEVNISENPIAGFTTNPEGEFCAGTPLALINESTNSSTYRWTVNGEIFSESSDPEPLILAAGPENTSQTYEIQLTAIGGCSSDTTSRSVTVLPEVRASFGAFPDTVCSGDTIQFNNNSLGLRTNCRWLFNSTLIETNCELPSQVFPEGDHMLSLEVSSQICGVVDTFDKSILIKPAEVNAFFEPTPDEVCLGEDMVFTSFATPFSTILWDFGDETGNFNSAIGDTIIHVYQDTGSYEVIQYARGCGLDSMKANVRVRLTPSLGLDVASQVCEGIPLAVTLETDAESYGTQVGAFSYNNLINFEHIHATADTLAITAFATNIYGCNNVTERTTIIVPAPEISITPFGNTVCADAEITLSGQSADAITQWQWDMGNGDQGSQQFLPYSFFDVGTYDISLIGVDENGCRDTAWVNQIEVIEKPLSYFIPEELEACLPVENLGFTNLSQGTNITAYTWNYEGGTSNVNNLRLDISESGIFKVGLTVENSGGCIDTFEDSVFIYPMPEAAIQFPDVSLCAPMEVPFTISPTDYTDITWRVNGFPVSKNENLTYAFLAPDTTHQVKLELSYEGFCKDFDSVEIAPVQQVTSKFKLSTTQRDSAQLVLINESQYATDYLWDFGGDVLPGPGSLEESPTITYVEPGEYTITLVAFNGAGCADTFSINRSYFPVGAIYAPSAFSPNDDGVNDEFNLISIYEVKKFYLEIFDRWGRMVFKSNDIDVSWDGTFMDGSSAPEGVYTFRCKHETLGGRILEPKGGTVTLIR